MREKKSSATTVAAMDTDDNNAVAEFSSKCHIGEGELDDLEFAADFVRALRPPGVSSLLSPHAQVRPR